MSNRELKELSDSALIALVKHEANLRSDSAVSELLRRYSEGIIRMAYLATRNEEFSRDCAQEVLVAIANGIQGFRQESEFSTWVYTISRRTIWKMARKRNSLAIKEISSDSSGIFGNYSTERSVTQEDRLISQEGQKEIFSKIETFPEKQKEAILLYYYHDYKLEEIAKLLGCSASTVKTHLYRGRASLAKKLVKVGAEF